MDEPGKQEFAVTNEIIQRLGSWVNAMADLLPRPVREPLGDGWFWSYPLQSAEVVQVAKAVRMASSFRAAWRLAEEGLITECYTVLRTAADFATEIMFVAEGIKEGKFNTSQKEFIDQFFAPISTDPDELAARAKESYVRRNKIIAARLRLLHKREAETVGRKIAFINKALDSYVHGAYLTAMELFNGETFMLEGHESSRSRSLAKKFIASKLYEAITALEVMARTRHLIDLVHETEDARNRLSESDESET